MELDLENIELNDPQDKEYADSKVVLHVCCGPCSTHAIEALDKTKNYYVYCKAGARSAQACSIMNQLGIANTYNLVGGFSQWQGEVSE